MLRFGLLLPLFFLTACSSFGNSTIVREKSVGSVESLITTADVRSVMVVPFDKATSTQGRITPNHIICAEPSPDVAKVASESRNFSGGLSINLPPTGSSPEIAAAAAGAASRSRAEALAQMTRRLATIQLLRDSLYRACEAYANGALTDTAYAIFLSRYDDVMITMLLADLASGGNAGGLATLGSKSSGKANSEATLSAVEAAKELGEAEKEAEAAEAAAGAPDAAAERNLANAAKASAESTAEALTSNAVSGPAAEPSAEIAKQLAEMQRRYMENINSDALMVACITAMDRDPSHPAYDNQLSKFCAGALGSGGALATFVAGQNKILELKIDRANNALQWAHYKDMLKELEATHEKVEHTKKKVEDTKKEVAK